MIICGTGHRPDKLGGYGQGVRGKLISVAVKALYDLTAGTWKKGTIPTVISGGALGWDQAIADAALQKSYNLHFYLPFEDFDRKWPDESRKHLKYQMVRAEEYGGLVKYISEPGYEVWKMQRRNEAMVDAADVVLALWNGTPGGTANCIRYAEKVGKKIVNVWDEFDV